MEFLGKGGWLLPSPPPPHPVLSSPVHLSGYIVINFVVLSPLWNFLHILVAK